MNPQQFALDLLALPTPTLENFVPGENGAALAALRDLLGGGGPSFVHLWGPPGSGRSHLLAAVARAAGMAPAEPIGAAGADAAPGHVPAFRPEQRIYFADDVHRLDSHGQARLFGLQNEVRQHLGYFLVTAADLPPARLALREDVRTRLAWGLVFALRPIGEPEQAAALAAYARSRGARVEDELVPYMLTRLPRDMRTLVSVLDALDAFALARQRALTVPLLREWLQQAPPAAFAATGQTSPVARQMNLPMILPLVGSTHAPQAGPGEAAEEAAKAQSPPLADPPAGSVPSGQ